MHFHYMNYSNILVIIADPRRKTGKNRNETDVKRVLVASIPVARRGRIETDQTSILRPILRSPSQDGEE